MTDLEVLYAMKRGEVTEFPSLMPSLSGEVVVAECEGMDKGRQTFGLYWHGISFATVAIINVKGKLTPVEVL